MPNEHTIAETQTAGFGLANGKVVHALVMEIDERGPTIEVREERREHPDPLDDYDYARTTTVDKLVVTPEDEASQRKIEIGTRHGQDRVIAEMHDLAPRAFVRHERQESGEWKTQASWELHIASGVTQTAGELATDGGQAALFSNETITETEEVPPTVWVVASRKEDSPHPYVEAVYDNEEAAREHERDLTNNAFQHGVVAWDVCERSVSTETVREDT